MKPIFKHLGLLAIIFGTVCSGGAAFTGPYATNNWTLVNSNANGTLDLTNAPAKIVLTGGNNLSYLPGYTEWRITAPASALLQFDWSYATLDDTNGPWDRAGWRQNDTYNEIVRNDSATRSGHVSAIVNAGDTFAFWVRTSDNLLAPGILTVTNFTVETAPPKFMHTDVSNQTVLLRLQTITGRTYRVEASTVLPATNWTQVGSNFTATTNLTFLNTSVSNIPHHFFRAVLLP